jgi:putative hydrolase of the HAD superfamily
MRHVQAVCLDLDDTLWELAPVLKRAEQHFHAWLTEHYPRVAARHSAGDLQGRRTAIAAEFPDRLHDIGWLRRQLYVRLARESGYPEAMADEAFAVFQQLRNQIAPFADVVPALRRLSRGRLLVALTNGNADLGAIGLAGHFAAVFTAAGLGVAKPDRLAFESVCARLGLPPDRVMHAGDDPHNDVIAPRQLGMTVVWVNRIGAAWPAGEPGPDHTVTDLAVLADLLGC